MSTFVTTAPAHPSTSFKQHPLGAKYSPFLLIIGWSRVRFVKTATSNGTRDALCASACDETSITLRRSLPSASLKMRFSSSASGVCGAGKIFRNVILNRSNQGALSPRCRQYRFHQERRRALSFVPVIPVTAIRSPASYKNSHSPAPAPAVRSEPLPSHTWTLLLSAESVTSTSG